MRSPTSCFEQTGQGELLEFKETKGLGASPSRGRMCGEETLRGTAG